MKRFPLTNKDTIIASIAVILGTFIFSQIPYLIVEWFDKPEPKPEEGQYLPYNYKVDYGESTNSVPNGMMITNEALAEHNRTFTLAEHNRNELVVIYADGRVLIPDTITIDDASRMFWTNTGRMWADKLQEIESLKFELALLKNNLNVCKDILNAVEHEVELLRQK